MQIEQHRTSRCEKPDQYQYGCPPRVYRRDEKVQGQKAQNLGVKRRVIQDDGHSPRPVPRMCRVDGSGELGGATSALFGVMKSSVGRPHPQPAFQALLTHSEAHFRRLGLKLRS